MKNTKTTTTTMENIDYEILNKIVAEIWEIDLLYVEGFKPTVDKYVEMIKNMDEKTINKVEKYIDMINPINYITMSNCIGVITDNHTTNHGNMSHDYVEICKTIESTTVVSEKILISSENIGKLAFHKWFMRDNIFDKFFFDLYTEKEYDFDAYGIMFDEGNIADLFTKQIKSNTVFDRYFKEVNEKNEINSAKTKSAKI